jgi:hypothetical protein
MSLAVICSHFNPSGFHIPRRNLLRFLRQLESSGISTFAAELAYDDDPYFLPSSPNVFHFRTARTNVLWHKENLLNLAVERIPTKYDKIAWTDTDIAFLSRSWAEDADRMLNSAAVVQLFSVAGWTDEDGRCRWYKRSSAADGFVKLGVNHPGFAWAARRALWSDAGGICERAVMGGGDTLFAAACLGSDVPNWMNYPDWKEWTHKSATWVRSSGGCGFIPGTVVHEWHGARKDRSYSARHSIVETINLTQSLRRDENGILQFNSDISSQTRNAILSYLRGRHEDGYADNGNAISGEWTSLTSSGC